MVSQMAQQLPADAPVRAIRVPRRFSTDGAGAAFRRGAHYLAPYTPDYFQTLTYRDAALDTAPVLFAAGVVGGLVGDLVLRRQDDTPKDDQQPKE